MFYFISVPGFISILFSIILHGIDEDLIQILQLSHIIIHNLFKPESVNTHFIGTLIFVLSCLKFAVINHQPIFTLFHIRESHI